MNMQLEYESFSLTINANDIEVPELTNENLYYHFKKPLLDLLEDKSNIVYFGYAPDNTADGQDELLSDGTFFRIIGQDRYLGIDIESSLDEIIPAFGNLIENYEPFWSTVIIERGETKTETTIEFLYKEL